MSKPFELLPVIQLKSSTQFFHVPQPPLVLHLSDKALDAMTDFQHEKAIVISDSASINQALTEMRGFGLHLLLVVNADDQVVGLISSEHIIGEKAILLSQKLQLPFSKLDVRSVMLDIAEIVTFDEYELRHAKVGNIVATLQNLNHHYALVVRVVDGKQVIIGMFSSHFISKRLGRDITSDIHEAHSLIELTKKLEE